MCQIKFYPKRAFEVAFLDRISNGLTTVNMGAKHKITTKNGRNKLFLSYLFLKKKKRKRKSK
jgi:hypothetical protein